MKKTYGLIVACAFIIFILLLLKVYPRDQSEEPARVSIPTINVSPTLGVPKNVDYQARFAIYTNGIKRIFTNSMYHNLSKNVYIEASDPSVLHVKKDGITWADFFLTLPMKLSQNCLVTGTKETFCATPNATLKFYLNGAKNDNLLFEKIKDGDSALISYGSENEAQIKSQLESVFPSPTSKISK